MMGRAHRTCGREAITAELERREPADVPTDRVLRGVERVVFVVVGLLQSSSRGGGRPGSKRVDPTKSRMTPSSRASKSSNNHSRSSASSFKHPHNTFGPTFQQTDLVLRASQRQLAVSPAMSSSQCLRQLALQPRPASLLPRTHTLSWSSLRGVRGVRTLATGYANKQGAVLQSSQR